jgi:hypothetical protein
MQSSVNLKEKIPLHFQDGREKWALNSTASLALIFRNLLIELMLETIQLSDSTLNILCDTE